MIVMVPPKVELLQIRIMHWDLSAVGEPLAEASFRACGFIYSLVILEREPGGQFSISWKPGVGESHPPDSVFDAVGQYFFWLMRTLEGGP